MPEPARETKEPEVLVVLDWLDHREVVYQINGGWAVDALVGRQTRPHRDLDVFVDDACVPEFVGWLRGRGFEVVENWLPVRVELASLDGRVDIHPMAIQPNGDGLQQGLKEQVFLHRAVDRTTAHISGRPVIVASAERLIELRQGYELRPEDLHDLALLKSMNG